jgi:aspartate racemase
MTEKTIGIIGGMGPEATADVFAKMVASTPSRKDQDHLRIVIDNNPKVPSRFKFIMGRGESPLSYLIHMAKKLEKYGADFLLIPCNAAHHFYDQIQKEVGIPILHISKEVRKHIRSMKSKPQKVGLMASGSTVKANVYQRVFRGSKIELILPSSKDQQVISEAIYSFKRGMRTKRLENKLMNVARSLRKMGAQAIILGCTELPVILRGGKSSLGFIDANEVLARAAVKKAKQG